jgi:hypothetical protein
LIDTGTTRAARWVWERLFGPPRIVTLEDGRLRVRVMGRVFEADDHEGLFRSVSAERERLVQAVSKLHTGTGGGPPLALHRFGPGDLTHRQLQRLEDRLAVYNEFLGHLVRRLQRDS